MPCICKIIRGIIEAIGMGQDTYMYMPYSQSFLDSFYHSFALCCYQVPCICKIIRGIITVIGKGLGTKPVFALVSELSGWFYLPLAL